MRKTIADTVIRARVTGEQKELLEQAAAAEGLSLSAWVRYHLIKKAQSVTGTKKKPPAPRKKSM